MTPEEKAILDELGATDAPPKDETARILAEVGATDAPPVVSPDARAKRWAELGITSREQAKAEAAEAKAVAAETTREGIAPDASLPQNIAHSPAVAGTAAFLGSMGRASALNAPAHAIAIDELLRDYGRRAIGRPSDGKSYNQRITEARAPQEELDREYPIASTVGSVVGGVASPANALAAPVAGAHWLANLGRAAVATGATTGASSLVGGQTLGDAAKDAGTAALASGAIGATAKAAQPVARWGGEQLKKLSSFLGGRALGIERGTQNAIATQLGGDPVAAKELLQEVVEDSYQKGIIRLLQTTRTGAEKFQALIDATGKRVGAASEAIEKALPAGYGASTQGLSDELAAGAARHARMPGGGGRAAVLAKEGGLYGRLAEEATKAGKAPALSFPEVLEHKRYLNARQIAANVAKAKSGEDAAVLAYGDIFDALKRRANEAAEAAGPELADEFKAANAAYWKYKKLDKATTNAIAQSLGNNNIPLRAAASPSAAIGGLVGLATTFPAFTGSAARFGSGVATKFGESLTAPGVAAAIGGGAARGALSPQRPQSGLEQYLSASPTGETEEEKRRTATQHFQRGN